MDIRSFAFRGPDVAEDIRAKYGFDGDLLRIFAGNTGPVVHKWHHYIPLYDRYFGRFRGSAVRFLEIGVSEGGSLQMWRSYLGPDAVIFGIDINPRCARLDGEAGRVRIGSQDDRDFLADVVAEMGGVDVVLDDGSHVMKHIRASLQALFPRLTEGGIYMIEDLHTSYWPKWGGAFGRARNFFRDLPMLIDDMHRAYHDHHASPPGTGSLISGIHVHDSIVVLEKDRVHPPVHSRIGRSR